MKASDTCIAVIGSVTYAMKAQKLLAAAAIPSHAIKLDATLSRHGCLWGIRFSYNQRNNVTAILQKNGIGIRATVSESGEAL